MWHAFSSVAVTRWPSKVKAFSSASLEICQSVNGWSRRLRLVAAWLLANLANCKAPRPRHVAISTQKPQAIWRWRPSCVNSFVKIKMCQVWYTWYIHDIYMIHTWYIHDIYMIYLMYTSHAYISCIYLMYISVYQWFFGESLMDWNMSKIMI